MSKEQKNRIDEALKDLFIVACEVDDDDLKDKIFDVTVLLKELKKSV